MRAIVFWIAQKLFYTTRTRSGPAPASRRRATAGKSAPGGTCGDPYGWWGMMSLVGLSPLPPAAQGHYLYEYPSHTAAGDM